MEIKGLKQQKFCKICKSIKVLTIFTIVSQCFRASPMSLKYLFKSAVIVMTGLRVDQVSSNLWTPVNHPFLSSGSEVTGILYVLGSSN